jgi:hypothetical protein
VAAAAAEKYVGSHAQGILYIALSHVRLYMYTDIPYCAKKNLFVFRGHDRPRFTAEPVRNLSRDCFLNVQCAACTKYMYYTGRAAKWPFLCIFIVCNPIFSLYSYI